MDSYSYDSTSDESSSIEVSEIVSALEKDDIEYIKNYIHENEVYDVGDAIDDCDLDLSNEMLDYLVQFDITRNKLIGNAIDCHNVEKLDYLFSINPDPKSDDIKGFLFTIIYNYTVDNISNIKLIILMVLNEYRQYINIYDLPMTPSYNYIEADIFSYIVFNLLDTILTTNNDNNDIDPILIEEILMIVLKTDGPQSLIDMLLNHISPNSQLHSKYYRDQFILNKPHSYLSLFSEDV